MVTGLTPCKHPNAFQTVLYTCKRAKYWWQKYFQKIYRFSMAEFLKLVWVLALLTESNQSEKSQVNGSKSTSSKLNENGVHQQFRETREAPYFALLFVGCVLTAALGILFCFLLPWPLFGRMKLAILWGTRMGRVRCMSQLFYKCWWRG